jgi:hypothetical protein
VYKEGTKNYAIDALSRLPLATHTTQMDL